MKIYLGTPGWGWTLWGIGYGSKWFLGFSMRRAPADDTGTIVLLAGKAI